MINEAYNRQQAIEITNSEFAKAILSPDPEGSTRLIRSSSVGNLRPADKAHPLDGRIELLDHLPKDLNNYLSVASFRRSEDGHYRATAKTFSALHALVLHDMEHGTHGIEAFVRPTWAMCLDKGRYEVGFVFDQPITHLGLANSLCASAEEMFPGHVRAYSAYMRLPVGGSFGPQPYVSSFRRGGCVDLRLLLGTLVLLRNKPKPGDDTGEKTAFDSHPVGIDAETPAVSMKDIHSALLQLGEQAIAEATAIR